MVGRWRNMSILFQNCKTRCDSGFQNCKTKGDNCRQTASSIRTCENNKKEQLSIDNGWHLI